jgi:hypothetical protein
VKVSVDQARDDGSASEAIDLRRRAGKREDLLGFPGGDDAAAEYGQGFGRRCGFRREPDAAVGKDALGSHGLDQRAARIVRR